MKKILALLLALAMVFALVACAKQATPAPAAEAPAAPAAEAPAAPAAEAPAAPAGVTELSLWTYPIGNWGDENTVKAFTDAFEAKTGIKVNVEFLAYGGDGDNKINTAISANQAPDMVMEGPERLAVQWGAQGHMVDLSDMLDDTDKAEINPSTLAAFTIDDGTLTGYPLCMNAHCMAINYTRFQNAGVADVIDVANRTWTTEGFEKAVKALAETNDTVAAVFCKDQGGDQGTRALVNNLYSGKFIDEARTAYQWDSAENVKALELLKELKGVNFDPAIVGGDEMKLFRQGVLDMVFCWNISGHKNTDDGNEVGKTLTGDEVLFMNFPTDDGKVELCGGIWGFGIFNNGDAAKIEASKQFIKFVCDSETTAEAVKASNFFPARTAAEGTDLTGIFAGDDDMNIYNATIMPNLGDYYTITPGFANVRPLWWQMLQKVEGTADVAALAADYAVQATATMAG
ncbi:MAG: extracellular solute-binding protein [Clostridiales bacterium]|nr:extracellular solute-binding protein [Clostridiales bacterium]